MPDCKYLIIGGGMAAASAITGIREIDDAGSIGVVTAEPHIYWNVYGSIGAGRRSIGSVIDL